MATVPVLGEPQFQAKVRVLKLHGSLNWWGGLVLKGGRAFFTTSGNSLGERPVIPVIETEALGYKDVVDPKCPPRTARCPHDDAAVSEEGVLF